MKYKLDKEFIDWMMSNAVEKAKETISKDIDLSSCGDETETCIYYMSLGSHHITKTLSNSKDTNKKIESFFKNSLERVISTYNDLMENCSKLDNFEENFKNYGLKRVFTQHTTNMKRYLRKYYTAEEIKNIFVPSFREFRLAYFQFINPTKKDLSEHFGMSLRHVGIYLMKHNLKTYKK